MEQVTLGRTGLLVSPVGLGCGGYSRLGMRQGKDEKQAERLVGQALDLGINFFDTARVYGTEEVVGRAVAHVRDQVVISTKTIIRDGDGNFLPAARLVESLEKSLTRLGTDCVDVFSFHGVTAGELDHCLDVLVPVMQQQIDAGKIRHLGITESFQGEPMHEMLERAVPAGCFDVVMVGFNFLNASARRNVFPQCLEHGVATQVMHAVRHVLTDEALLAETIAGLVDAGEIDPAMLEAADPVAAIRQHPEVASLTEAAYRFCRHEPGATVVLTGTGNIEHLKANVAALQRPPLPADLQDRLQRAFGSVRTASGD